MEQTGPLEVGIPVVDLDRMLQFYEQALSCQEVRRSDIPVELSRALATSRDGYLNVWLRAPGGEIIKLIRPPAPPAREAGRDFIADRTGLAFLTFYCKDIETVLANAEAHGAVVRSDRGCLDGSIGVKLVFFADPEGNVIELVERP
jgi:catechol 2,3-dioxygenase-like lactoylglutathione lyase family enzyme